MGIFDKAKDMMEGHEEQVDGGLDKGAEFVDERTGSQYSEQVNQGETFVEGQLGVPDADKPAAPPAS
jgi:MT0933-like antitoxin protein